MKEKLHKELNRIAKHILAANDSSEISSLYEAAKSLYEKLAVLKFIEKELADPTLNTEESEVADQFKEMASEVLQHNDLIPENNPHPTDIITPGMETIKDMVSEMPAEEKEETTAAMAAPNTASNAVSNERLKSGTMNTSNTTINGQYGQELHFGLNDRIAFVKQLFAADEEDFKRVISQLATIDTQERALSFIENLVKPEYEHWKGKEAIEQRFLALVCQRYQ